MNLRPEFPFLPAAVLVLGPAIPARSQNPADSPKTVWTHHGSFYSPGTKLCSLQSSPTGTYFWRGCATNL